MPATPPDHRPTATPRRLGLHCLPTQTFQVKLRPAPLPPLGSCSYAMNLLRRLDASEKVVSSVRYVLPQVRGAWARAGWNV